MWLAPLTCCWSYSRQLWQHAEYAILFREWMHFTIADQNGWNGDWVRARSITSEVQLVQCAKWVWHCGASPPPEHHPTPTEERGSCLLSGCIPEWRTHVWGSHMHPSFWNAPADKKIVPFLSWRVQSLVHTIFLQNQLPWKGIHGTFRGVLHMRNWGGDSLASHTKWHALMWHHWSGQDFLMYVVMSMDPHRAMITAAPSWPPLCPIHPHNNFLQPRFP